MALLVTACGAARGVETKGHAGKAPGHPGLASVDPTPAERELFDLVNGARRDHGLPELRWHGAAAVVSRAHCRDMLEQRQIFHESPRTGAPSDRVHRAGLRVPVVMENVASAPTVARAHDGLMKSPGHRANILSREATHVGVGIVSDPADGQLYATQLFLRVLAPFDPAAARDEVRRLVTARRKTAGVPVPAAAPALDAAAQRLAELAAANDGSFSDAEYQQAVGGLQGRFGRVRASVSVVAEPGQATRGEALTGPAAAIGVGLAQGRHSELGDNTAFVVVIVAEPR